MTDRQTQPPVSPSVEASSLGRAIFLGLVALGLLSGAARVVEVRAPNSDSAQALDVLRIVFGYSLAGWFVMRLCQEAGGAAARVEAALESARSGSVLSVEPVPARVAEIRQALRAREWVEARSLLVTFRETFPDRPEPDRLGDELIEAERVAREALGAQIEAAREVNDPERVIELRGQLGPLLEGEAIRALDRDLAKWFLHLIHRRLRTGTVRPDVAALAARVAETLNDTPEGASLRASLPTLRRAAGLCPRCGEPYKGLADACPDCLGALPAAIPFVPGGDDEDLEAIEHVDEFGIGQLGD